MSLLAPPIEELWIGPVRVVVRYGCVRRDQYELLTTEPFPASLRQHLEPLGVIRGSAVLYTVDVANTHQLTVAPARGRMVIMPRLSVERAQQRQSALAIAERLSVLMKES